MSNSNTVTTYEADGTTIEMPVETFYRIEKHRKWFETTYDVIDRALDALDRKEVQQ